MGTQVTFPSGAGNITPAVHTVPAAGELNWAALDQLLIDLATGAQSTTFQKVAVRQALTTPVTMLTTDCVVTVKLTSPGAVAANLPAGANKQVLYILDETRDAATNTVTVTAAGSDTIEGSATTTMETDGEALFLIFDSSATDWKILGRWQPGKLLSDFGGLTASRALVSSAGGIVAVATTTATEIGYVNGVTSAIQTQLNALAVVTTEGDVIIGDGSGNPSRLAIGSTGKIMGSDGSTLSWIPNDTSTTWFTGGVITINADTTKYDVALGTGIICNPTTGVKTPVSWIAKTLVAPANIATETITHILIDVNGDIFETNSEPTPEQLRTYIDLGSVVHLDGVNIVIATVEPLFASGPGVQVQDLYRAIGNINLSGNDYSSAATVLTLNKSAGSVVGVGINTSNLKAPNIKATPSDTPLTWFYNYETTGSFTVVASVTDIDPAQYNDPALGLVAMPNNKFQIQRMFYNGQNETTVIQYGQETYSTLAGAEAALATEAFNKNPDLETFPLRGYLIVKKGTTDLSNTGDAKFIRGQKIDLGGAGGGATTSTTTQQAAYNNSGTLKIGLTSTAGEFSIEDNATPIGTDLWSIKSDGGSTEFITVDANEVTVIELVDAGLTASRAVVSGSGKKLESSATTTTEIGYVSGVTSSIQTQLAAKQANIITTRGDIIRGSSGGSAERLALGNNGQTLQSDGTDLVWGEGGASAGGKNYILNPDATADTSNVANTSASGNWTVTRSVLAAELPEESKGTAFKVVADASVALDDTVEWAIPSTFIDDADGGPATLEFKVKAIGTITGDYKFQLYSKTDSTYIGESLVSAGDGTYTFGANIIAGDDYELHLIALVTDPDDIGLSGIKLEPNPLLKTAIISSWQPFTPVWTNMTPGAEAWQYRQDGENYDFIGQSVFNSTGGSTMTMEMPNGHTISLIGNPGGTVYQHLGAFYQNATATTRQYGILGKDGETTVKFSKGTTAGSFNPLTAVAGSQFNNNRHSFKFSVPILELAKTGVVVPASDLMRRTKQVELSLTESIVGFSLARAVGIAYQDSTGAWRCKGNIVGTYTAATASVTVSVDGCTWKNVTDYYQAVTAGETSNTTDVQAFATFNSGNITIKSPAGSSRNEFSATFDLELEGQPTDDFVGADSNFSSFTAALENSLSIAAYLPGEEAVTTLPQQLLVNYREEVVDCTQGTSSFTGTADLHCLRIGNMVVLTSTGDWSHASSSGPSTGDFVIPAQYRPSHVMYNAYRVTSVYRTIDVSAAGKITFAYASNRTGTEGGFTVSFVIT